MKPVYLVITPFFPDSQSFRGPYVYDQVRALQNLEEFQVVVLKPVSCFGQVRDYCYNGIEVHCFPAVNLPSNIFPGVFDRASLYCFFRTLKGIGVDPGDIAVAHAHVTGQGIFVNALKQKNPAIISVLQHHGFDVLSLDNGRLGRCSWHRRFVARYGVKICNQIDVHVGVSRATLNRFDEYPEIKLKRSMVLYNGVDLNKFYPTPSRVRTEKFRIGCIANFWPLKDHMTLIKAVELLIREGDTEIEVEFIGSGKTLPACQKYIAEQGLTERFHFHSEKQHAELIAFYHSLDLFVLPSYWETLGCVYLEAHACGVPFIGCYGQGIEEFIPEMDKARWLIHKGDFQQLAHLIQQQMETPASQELAHDINIVHLMGEYIQKLFSR